MVLLLVLARMVRTLPVLLVVVVVLTMVWVGMLIHPLALIWRLLLLRLLLPAQ
jgi:hypothetical protein